MLAVLVLLLGMVLSPKKRSPALQPFPEHYRELLAENVDYYKQLDIEGKKAFEERMHIFLSRVRITGVKTGVEDLDRVLVAASAIIPIFGFADWEYINLDEVLLYPDSFNHAFDLEGNDRGILGLVGEGAYQRIMILSKPELRQGFLNKTGKANTAIHEFVHLVDKTDGSIDGIPEFLLEHRYVLPWLKLMQKEISHIMANRSDINPYGATNEAEFLAVAAEYFFERPGLFKNNHPELYDLLSIMFRQQPVAGQ